MFFRFRHRNIQDLSVFVSPTPCPAQHLSTDRYATHKMHVRHCCQSSARSMLVLPLVPPRRRHHPTPSMHLLSTSQQTTPYQEKTLHTRAHRQLKNEKFMTFLLRSEEEVHYLQIDVFPHQHAPLSANNEICVAIDRPARPTHSPKKIQRNRQ